jgi:DNA-directed RNA polymerase subunit RPC12/RpoP
MEKLIIKPLQDTFEILVTCSACGRQVVKAPYNSYHEYKLKERQYKKMIAECPYCKARYKPLKESNEPIVWKRVNGDWQAIAEKGVFNVWKWGKAWKWSFRYNGEQSPRAENTGTAFIVDVAKRCCENHKEWR